MTEDRAPYGEHMGHEARLRMQQVENFRRAIREARRTARVEGLAFGVAGLAVVLLLIRLMS